MATETRELVALITHGIDHELSSAGLVIALGGMTANLKASIFLTSSGVDLVRRDAADTTPVEPLDPLADMLRNCLARGGSLWACPPRVKIRGDTQENPIDGVVITDSSVMHEAIERGAATLSF